MNLFRSGDFTLSGMGRSRWKIDCDALTDEDWATLARLIKVSVPPFGRVIGVPTGGLKLAKALEPFAQSQGPTLVVDDVMTTGRSMLRAMRKAMIDHPTERCIGAVVFSRGCMLPGVFNLFQTGAKFPEPWQVDDRWDS